MIFRSKNGRTGRADRHLLALAAASLLVSMLSPGCDGTRRDTPSRTWKRIDLLVHPPDVLDPRRGADDEIEQARPRLTFLGPKPLPGGGLRGAASHVGALYQLPDVLLVARAQLGHGARFRFRPLSREHGPCRCRYRIWVATEGPPGDSEPVAGDTPTTEIPHLAHRIEGYSRPVLAAEIAGTGNTVAAAAFETVDLSSWDGRSVALLLEVTTSRSGRWRARRGAYWVSPAILFEEVATPTVEESPSEAPARPPSILMIGADTLRARALGAWGRTPSVTPALDRMARDGEVWLNAYSAFNTTNPSFTSVHTGLYGKNHGVYNLSTDIPQDRPTLARRLSEEGYATFGMFAVYHLGAAGLPADFDDVFRSQGTTSAELIVDQTLDRIDKLRHGDKPFFGFVHLFDPHLPHTPPDPFGLGRLPARSYGIGPVEEWSTWRDDGRLEIITDRRSGGATELYYDEVAYMDRQIDRLLGQLEEWQLLDDTVVVFFADHGENLDEHDLRYSHVGLWETTTHVPLMIRWPDSWRSKDAWRSRFGARHEHLVQSLDLYPTLLQIAGAEVPAAIDGRSLLAGEQREFVFFEHAHRRGVGIRSQQYLLIEMQGQEDVADGSYLYDVVADPDELSNVFDERPTIARELGRRIDEWQADRLSTDGDGQLGRSRVLTEEERLQLEALGYVDG